MYCDIVYNMHCYNLNRSECRVQFQLFNIVLSYYTSRLSVSILPIHRMCINYAWL